MISSSYSLIHLFCSSSSFLFFHPVSIVFFLCAVHTMSTDGFDEYSSERPNEAREENRMISVEDVTRIARETARQVLNQMLPEVVRTVLETQRQSSHTVDPSHQDFEMGSFEQGGANYFDRANPQFMSHNYGNSHNESKTSSQGVPRNFPNKPGGSGGPLKKKGRFNKCFLCNSDDHPPSDCFNVPSRTVREQKLKEANRCLKCFKWYGHHQQNNNCAKQCCPICSDMGHGYGLCPGNHNTIP